MKHFILALILAIPMGSIAQSQWEIPLTPEQQAAKAEQAKKEAKKQAKQEAKLAKEKAREDEAARKRIEAAQQDEVLKNRPHKGLLDKGERNSVNKNVTLQSDESTPNVATNNPQEPSLKEDPKYLEGAVPTNADNKVEWILKLDIPGKTADDIYQTMYRFCDQLVSGSDQIKGSRIVLVNKEQHIIVAQVREWLVFQNSALSLDRTEFNYQLLTEISDGHLIVKMNRISYNYEKERPSGFNATAEEWITDAVGLNKKHTKLSKMSGKFRKKTIDRKNQLFNDIITAFK